MTHSSESVTIVVVVVVVLVNLWQTAHLIKHNSQLCGPTVTADGVLLHGNDQIVLPNQQYNPENASLVQFAFKTTSTEGLLLLYTSSESSAALQSLELVDGKLHFRLNFGPDSTVMISRDRYNDGNWHDLETKRTSEHLYMLLDGILVSTALVPENFSATHDDSSVIYIGNFKETQHPRVTAKGFKGFVRNFRLGNVAVDLKSLIRKSGCHKRIRGRRGSEENNCGAVTGFDATYFGATNLELSWSSKDCDMEYEVEIKDLVDVTFRNYTTKDHHIEIKNLTPNVTYEFTLCGKSSVNVTTGYFSSLIVDKVTDSSITVHWEVVENSPSEFKLTIFDKTGTEIKTTKEGASSPYEFRNLKPGSDYHLELSDDVNNRTWSNRTIKTKGVFLDNFNCRYGTLEGEIDCSWGRGSGYYCGVNYQLNISEPVNSTVIGRLDLPNHKTTLCTIYKFLPEQPEERQSGQFEKLRPGQNYSISIQYFVSNNYTSKVMNATAVAKTGISKTLLEQSISSSNHNFTINYFIDPDREVELYHIEVNNGSHELSPNNTSVLIDNLKAGLNYTISAIASSNGVESENLSITVGTVPNPPSMVQCTNSSTRLTVEIKPPMEGGFDDYEISYNGVTAEKGDNSKVVDKTITHVLKDLKPYTNYTIKVKYRMNFKNLHSQEKSKICATLEGTPSKVRDLNISAVSATGFTVTWKSPEPPNGVITGYVVTLFNNQGGLIKTYTTDERTQEINVDISEQKPEQRKYRITVAAKTAAGEGDQESFNNIELPKVQPSQALLISALVILTILLVVLIGLLGYYFIRKSPSRMQSVRRISSRLMHPNNEVRYFKQPSVSSKPVKISDFVTYLEKLEKDSGLKLTEEYEDLKFVGRNQSKDDAELQCNRVKNRFTNILPYDISRVKLLAMEDEDGSDYINASWIPGFHSKREFIASQGPLPSTVNDFWRMIWENNCQAIVMLTLCIEKGHIKCEQYWPVQNEPVCYGDVKVEMQNEEKNEEWHTREFKISMGSQSRKLIHFHYVTWPDMYVPQRMSLIEFVREIRAILNKNNGKGPIVVHCSAGVGRSGTFIALDTLLHQILADHDLDVYGVVFQMRMNRVLMVQTEAQYTFIYECLKQILDEKNGQTAVEENAEPENCREGVKKEETEVSDSKEKQSQTGCTAAESNLNSETKEKVQAKEPERNNDEAQDSSSSIKDEPSPKENAAKSESKSNLNSDESSSKTNGETKNLEISSQNLGTGDGKNNDR